MQKNTWFNLFQWLAYINASNNFASEINLGEPSSMNFISKDSNVDNLFFIKFILKHIKYLIRICLRQGKRGGEINDEIGLQISQRDLPRIRNKLSFPENLREGRRTEFHDHVKKVEQVGDGASDGESDLQFVLDFQAAALADVREEEVERVDEEGDEAGDEEDVVPVGDDVAARVEDLVAP